jgi:hypothetical protein
MRCGGGARGASDDNSQEETRSGPSFNADQHEQSCHGKDRAGMQKL